MSATAAPAIVLFCMPERGHVQRSLAVIEALATRGCSVQVFTGPDYAAAVQRAGGSFHDLS